MSVTHSLGTTHRATPARRGERLSSLSTLLRLLSPTWRNAGWMLDNAPLSLQETLGEQQFIGWVLGVAGETAMNAVGSFASQPAKRGRRWPPSCGTTASTSGRRPGQYSTGGRPLDARGLTPDSLPHGSRTGVCSL